MQKHNYFDKIGNLYLQGVSVGIFRFLLTKNSLYSFIIIINIIIIIIIIIIIMWVGFFLLGFFFWGGGGKGGLDIRRGGGE